MGFKHPIWIILTLVALVLSQTLYQASIYWISYWSKQSDQKSSFYIEVMGVLVAMTYVAVFFRVYSLINGIFSSTLYLHNSALQSVALTNSEFYDKNPTGRIINRFSKDIGSTDGPLQLYIYESISTSAIIVSNIIVAIVIVPYNLIIIPIWVLIIGLLLKFVSPAIIQLRKIELTSRGPIISTMSSCLNGLPTIRCLNLQSKFLSDFEKYIDIHYRSYLTFQTFLRFNTAYCDLSSGLIAILNVIIIVGTKGLIQPSLAAYSLASCGGLMGITAMWSKNLLEVGSCMSTAQRLMEYADLEPEGEFECGEKFIIEKGDVKFDRIFMRYRLNLPFTLTGLSFHIRGGQKVGIIGRTGAGKSSVLQVLFRLVNPESGNIYLDGYDYMKLGLHDLRLQMSVIPQSAVLFSASIRDNLDPFHKYSDDEILQALEDVGLKNTILEYDEGLLVEVKNEVLSLSAGQKQLLCLARAILRKNKIIMMDEATANVDNETDRIMQETVKGKFEGCTMMIIAHRIRTIVESDRIIVMDKGMCVEFGKPKELFMEDNSLFRQMVMHTGPEESTFLAEKIENFEKKKMITKN
jgi:ATP-binding cassette subfamily C (CFTR/MRP) protein 4